MKKCIRIYIIIFLQSFFLSTYAQEITLGTLTNTEEALSSYTLFAPFNSFNAYLVNNCGELINEWGSDQRLAASVYLTDDAELVRTYKVSSSFFGGGAGGGIEIFNWEGDRIWHFEYASDQYLLHHDIEILPNGNILAIAWVLKSAEEAVSKGKVGNVPPNGLWPDRIIEIQRGGSNDKEIVWSWDAWDHLIQDVDPSKENYGEVALNPERININIYSNEADWIHLNSIDYHPELDQILVGSRHFSEIWVIDHSTTTEEAASSEGGMYGKGGDLLYRWGNPFAYKSGFQNDQRLFGQHDAEWISENRILLFNNGDQRSSVDILNLPIDENGFYDYQEGQPYLPDDFSWSYDGGVDNVFFSASVSGTAQLDNGNILVASGEEGRIFELSDQDEIVWDYIIPVGPQVFAQGDDPFLNQFFKSEKYAVNDNRFNSVDVSSQGPLELNPVGGSCELISSTDDSLTY